MMSIEEAIFIRATANLKIAQDDNESPFRVEELKMEWRAAHAALGERPYDEIRDLVEVGLSVVDFTRRSREKAQWN